MEVKKTLLAYLLLTVLAVQIFGSELSHSPIRAEEREREQEREQSAEGSQKRIALTFDDGPSEKSTGAILDLLAKYHIRATFFVVGVNVCKNPQMLRREAEQGHEIGNHTFSHPHLRKLDQAALEGELRQTADTVYAICGKSIELFRPPEGYLSDSVEAASRDLGYRPVLWTIDTRDWAHSSTSKIVRTVEENAKDGSIVLMHDCIVGESHTLEALEKIIPDLIAKGFVFVTVPELG